MGKSQKLAYGDKCFAVRWLNFGFLASKRKYLYRFSLPPSTAPAYLPVISQLYGPSGVISGDLNESQRWGSLT